jgi:hypothetical protein
MEANHHIPISFGFCSTRVITFVAIKDEIDVSDGGHFVLVSYLKKFWLKAFQFNFIHQFYFMFSRIFFLRCLDQHQNNQDRDVSLLHYTATCPPYANVVQHNLQE